MEIRRNTSIEFTRINMEENFTNKKYILASGLSRENIDFTESFMSSIGITKNSY